MTVWRRDADGQWRCVVDLWNDPPAVTAAVKTSLKEAKETAVSGIRPARPYRSFRSSTTITSMGCEVSLTSACIWPGGSASSQYAFPLSQW